jgi:hypothetical protein
VDNNPTEGSAAASRYGRLRIIGLADATARRAIVRCDCGSVLTVGVAALAAGENRSCGCTKTLERREAARPLRRIDWRMERGR